MSVDWAGLNKVASSFTSRILTEDPVSGGTSVVCVALETSMSTVLAGLPAGADSITVCADTLVLDVPVVTTTALVAVARVLDTSALSSGVLTFSIPPSEPSSVVELLVGSFVGEPPAVAVSSGSARVVPAGMSPLKATVLSLGSDGSLTELASGTVADVQDLVSRAPALSAFQAIYAAAARLMDSESADDRAQAQSMFSWIVTCIGPLGQGGGSVTSDYAELCSQAGALLVTLNVAPGGFFVPILAADLYTTQSDRLLGAMAGYEAALDTLTVQKDVAKAVADVSSTLQATAADEEAPLKQLLANMQDNMDMLADSIVRLRSLFVLQADQADTDYQVLAGTMREEAIMQFLQDSFKMTMDAMSAGISIGGAIATGNPASLATALNSFTDGVTTSIDALGVLQKRPPGGDDMADRARQIMQMQQALMTSFQAAVLLLNQSDDGGSGTALPASLGVVDIDPSLAWDNYLIEAQNQLSTIKEQIGSASVGAKAQAAADRYLASLQVLGGYGKAIDGKYVAYSAQAAQASVVRSQIAAAAHVAQDWQAREAKAKSDEEKLTILQGVVQSRIDALKRSVFVVWSYYRASYFYVHLVEPPHALKLEMSSAQMKDALAGVADWVDRLLGTAPDGQHVVLPNSGVSITLRFPIRTAGSSDQPVTTDAALLTTGSTGQPTTVTWSIPLGTDQLKGVLPNGGQVAIWITSARFFVEGVKPNPKGNVMMSVATSGTYQNGFGSGKGQTFIGKGLIGDFAYEAESRDPYTRWTIPTQVYMTPTPYTQWDLTFDPDGGDPTSARELCMELEVAYMEPAASA